MARYIDAEKMQVNCLKDKKFVFAMENLYTQEVIMEIVYKDFLDFLNEQPTADVVEVVRCNDCVLHNKCITEDVFILAGKQDGFCCVGKKVE